MIKLAKKKRALKTILGEFPQGCKAYNPSWKLNQVAYSQIQLRAEPVNEEHTLYDWGQK